jgi:CheY-like chemotaxis protein
MESLQPLILIVEDDDVYRYLEERILQRAGYRTCYTDATEVAWETVNASQIDLIVLDADELRQKPYESKLREEGLRFLKALRASAKGEHIPVVVTTSKLPLNAPDWRQASMNAGANAFFEHEFDLDAFVEKIGALINS